MPWGWGCTYSNIFGFPILAHRSRFVRLILCFFCIGLTLFENNCSNETFVGVDSIRLSFQPFGNQWNQYSLVMVMGVACIGNCFTKLCSTKFLQQSFFLTSYSFTKVQICQSYFYFIIRFLFPDKLHILNTNNIVKSCTLVLNDSKSWYKDTIQVCFTSLWGQKILTFLIQTVCKKYQHHSDNYC